nr:MAG TPA: hypothetical protein [Caudoviricetes sp.]
MDESIGMTRLGGDLMIDCNFVKSKFSEVVILKLLMGIQARPLSNLESQNHPGNGQYIFYNILKSQ